MTRALTLLCFAAVMALPHSLRAQDGSEFIVRLNRVEGQMRQLSGQVEQLQFENRQLKEQLKKFQEDVEFRFQERGGRSATPAPAGAAPPASRPERPAKRSDAFDPAQSPDAPGSPRSLGSASAAPSQAETVRGAGDSRGGDRPSGRGGSIASIIDNDDEPPGSGRPLDLGAAARGGGSGAQGGRSGAGPAAEPQARGPVIASSGGDDSKADYDIAYAYLMQRQYDQSEASFRRFIQSHPRDRLVPDATFWLGESYLQRSRPREAAEQFLKVSTEFARSGKAPDAMLKLGISLAALGAKDQACATFAELERKHPGASPSVKQGVDREQKRVRCPA